MQGRDVIALGYSGQITPLIQLPPMPFHTLICLFLAPRSTIALPLARTPSRAGRSYIDEDFLSALRPGFYSAGCGPKNWSTTSDHQENAFPSCAPPSLPLSRIVSPAGVDVL